MSRAAGQITTGQALRGGLVVVLAVLAVVVGAHALLSRPAAPPGLDDVAPARPVQPCPTPRETTPRPTPPRGPTRPVPVHSTELLGCPTAYDGREVVIEGEVVRAVLRRGGDRAWVQLNDDVYGVTIGPLPRHRTPRGANTGIAVSIPAAAADAITALGGPHSYGDRLRVQGRFLRADPSDAGGPAIQADIVEIVAAGEPVDRPVTPARVVAALLLGAAATTMTLTARRADR